MGIASVLRVIVAKSIVGGVPELLSGVAGWRSAKLMDKVEDVGRDWAACDAWKERNGTSLTLTSLRVNFI